MIPALPPRVTPGPHPLDDDLFLMPRPSLGRAAAGSVLAGELYGPFHRGNSGPGGWIIVHAPELHIGGDQRVLVPDLAGWRREVLPELPSGMGVAVPPTWLCEVLSLSTKSFVRVRKLAVYAEHGVDYVWLVDPDARFLEVLQLDRGSYRIVSVLDGAETVRAPPFEAIELELPLLWKDAGPPSPER
jgi:Uma2 family endonuclease